jgi:hypothetical protein
VTALEKLLAAREAGRQPAPGTYKNAMAEINDMLIQAKLFMFQVLVVEQNYDKAEKLWDMAMRLAEVKGGLDIQGTYERGFEEVVKKINATPPKEVISAVAAMEPTKCSNCNKRDAKVWEKGAAYCKQCAKELGVDFHGKV